MECIFPEERRALDHHRSTNANAAMVINLDVAEILAGKNLETARKFAVKNSSLLCPDNTWRTYSCHMIIF
jgi:hypothetical protein